MAAGAREPPVPIIRFVKKGCENDLEEVPLSVRQYIFKSYAQQNVAVLVSDMSGFTRLTRKYGIIHFASIIARVRQLLLPYIHANGAMVITTEGDSFNVIFPSVDAAVRVGICMQRISRMYNESLPAERSHFTLPLEGVGVAFGPGPYLDRQGKLIGETFKQAHELGEELCKGNMIAISSAARKQIENSSDLDGAVFRPLQAPPGDDEVAQALVSMGGGFELVTDNVAACGALELGPVEDDRYVQPALLPFARRHDPSMTAAELERLDAQLREAHMFAKVALMLNIACENAEDPNTELRLKYECLRTLSSCFARHHAEALEDVLYFFDSPADAILCALDCRRAMRSLERGRTDPTQPRARLSGYGIHVGDVLIIPGTDIHWGDPVNTASKLGEEIAVAEEVIISQPAFEACKNDPRLRGLSFQQFHITISGVELHPYKISDEVPIDTEGPAAAVRSNLLDEFQKSGLVRGANIDRGILVRLLKTLDPELVVADLEALMSHIGRGKERDISVPAFLDWVLGMKQEG